MVFTKIVERRPQNSRLGLPRLRSRIPGLEQAHGMGDGNKQAAEAEQSLLSPRPEAEEWPSGTSMASAPASAAESPPAPVPPPPGRQSEA